MGEDLFERKGAQGVFCKNVIVFFSVATELVARAAPGRRVARRCTAPRPPLLLCRPREDKEATEAALSLSPRYFPLLFPRHGQTLV